MMLSLYYGMKCYEDSVLVYYGMKSQCCMLRCEGRRRELSPPGLDPEDGHKK